MFEKRTVQCSEADSAVRFCAFLREKVGGMKLAELEPKAATHESQTKNKLAD